jgi:predicted RNase H-like HicB family nuclease
MAMATFFPAVVEGSSTEGYGADVLGTGVDGSGATVHDALVNAAEVLQEVIDDLAASGEPIPSPGRVTHHDAARGTVALLQARVPAEAA